MVICYLQESSLVILSWKGNDVLHRGLVMLGNKLHIFISFPYCVVLSTHARTKNTLNLQYSKHTYGGMQYLAFVHIPSSVTWKLQ